MLNNTATCVNPMMRLANFQKGGVRLEVGPDSTGKKQEKDEQDERNRRLERRDLQQILWRERNTQEMVDGAAQDKKDAFVRKLELSPDAARLLEQATRGQSSSAMVFSQESPSDCLKLRSRLPDDAKNRPREPCQEDAESSRSAHFCHGIKRNECGANGTEGVPRHFKQRQGKLVSVEMSGLVVNDHFTFLGVSPDALVCDPSEDPPDGLWENESPYSTKDHCHLKCPEEASLVGSNPMRVRTAEGNVTLKRSHQYFAQIQGQMAVTGRHWCDFCIYTEEGGHVERIRFSEAFWTRMLPKLKTFYNEFPSPSPAQSRCSTISLTIVYNCVNTYTFFACLEA